jgi:hypothetical protein
MHGVGARCQFPGMKAGAGSEILIWERSHGGSRIAVSREVYCWQGEVLPFDRRWRRFTESRVGVIDFLRLFSIDLWRGANAFV